MVELDPFIQLKIDYVQFMMQIYKLMAYDETTIGILFSLMLENYLTVDELETLTGFTKPTIIKAVTRISNIYDETPILQTKKPISRKKYYYCPLSLELYLKQSFLSFTEATDINLSEFISRIKSLSPKTPDIIHIESVLSYLQTAIFYYRYMMKAAGDYLDKLLDDPQISIDFLAVLDNIKPPLIEPVLINKDETILNIKQGFIQKMVETAQDLIVGNEDSIKVFLALFLEAEPVTQDKIIKVTKVNRTQVSQTLTMMEELKVLQVIRKEGDRKKYYKSASRIEDYGTGKLSRVQGYYSQIQRMMEQKFIPDLEKIKQLTEKDKKEATRLRKFFESNIYYYGIFIKFSTNLHESIGKKMREIIGNNGNDNH
ncbi:hypothetical protein [Candidatus Hodarchaeum mangrovi]